VQRPPPVVNLIKAPFLQLRVSAMILEGLAVADNAAVQGCRSKDHAWWKCYEVSELRCEL